ncbi:MAG: hypothetical protein KDA57_22960 [Planctomycetales bacterium]|nr:hypothetical protein [Planctomycetales bacterium]
MEEQYYFSRAKDENRLLTIAPITDSELEATGEEIENTGGYFLVETTKLDGCDEVRVIAQLPNSDAAIALSRLLNMD